MKLTKETEKGVLKYRMPNILEAFDLLEASGLVDGETRPLRLKRNIIENMEKFIDFSEVKDVSTYSELLEDVEFMVMPLGTIADEIILKTFEVFKKKHS